MTVALVLTGGGARGAYQAGVLKAISEFPVATDFPFQIITGVSSGAINASYIASNCDDFPLAAKKLADIWSNLKTKDVYRTDITSISQLGLRWIKGLLFGGIGASMKSNSLLDTSPLRRLLQEKISFSRIEEMIDSDALGSLEISTTDYSSSENVSFFMSKKSGISWKRAGRRSSRTSITIDHILASSAIPLFFPPIKINSQAYGDGCLRNAAPLSPAIKLGASKILLISARQDPSNVQMAHLGQANIGRILSVLLNAVLLESTDQDMERIDTINKLLKKVAPQDRGDLRLISNLALRPSIDIGKIAGERFHHLPPIMRYLLHGLGDKDQVSEIVSYLMFEPEYSKSLVHHGYQDTYKRRDEITKFLEQNAEAN